MTTYQLLDHELLPFAPPTQYLPDIDGFAVPERVEHIRLDIDYSNIDLGATFRLGVQWRCNGLWTNDHEGDQSTFINDGEVADPDTGIVGMIAMWEITNALPVPRPDRVRIAVLSSDSWNIPSFTMRLFPE